MRDLRALAVSTPAIETFGLTKFYEETRGIEDLDLRVEWGEAFGYLGPNGAGKTTTIRRDVHWIMREKLRKRRLSHADPAWVARWTGELGRS